AIRLTIALAACAVLAPPAFAQQGAFDPRAPRPAGPQAVQGAQQQAGQVPQARMAAPPAAPFQLSPQQQAEVDNLLKAWEKKSSGVVTLKTTFDFFEYDLIFGPKDGRPKRQSTGEIRFVAP